MSVRYTAALRQSKAAERAAARAAHRAGLSQAEAESEVYDVVNVTPQGLVEVWDSAECISVHFVTVAEFAAAYRANTVPAAFYL